MRAFISSRRRAAVVAALVAAAVTAPVTAVATHRFSDVPDSAFYHQDTADMADAGITTGCGSGAAYCPDTAVTRGQMAAFLGRGLPRTTNQDFSSLVVEVTDADDPAIVAFLDVTVPGQGGTQILQFDADMTVDGLDYDCPCGLAFAWAIDSDPNQIYDGGLTIVGTGGVNGLVHTSGAVRVPAGTHSIDLLVTVIDANPTGTEGATFNGMRNINASTFPLSLTDDGVGAAGVGAGNDGGMTRAEWRARAEAAGARLLGR